MRVILETPRLVLREMSMSDLDFVAQMLGDPEVMRFYPKVNDREEAAANINRQLQRYAEDGYGPWLVLSKESGLPVGRVGLIHQVVEGQGETEVGYMIHRPYWRQGLAFEAASACRDYAFDVLGRKRVISLVRPENTPSQGVARKLGMMPQREVIHWGLRHLVFVLAALH